MNYGSFRTLSIDEIGGEAGDDQRCSLLADSSLSFFVVFALIRWHFPMCWEVSCVETWNLIQGKLWELSEKLVA